jgi:hypothetical protein
MLDDIENQSDKDGNSRHSRDMNDKRRAESPEDIDDDNECYSDLDFYGK